MSKIAVSNLDKLKDRIWITERCHMNAEKRSRFLDLYFHIVLALFALASIFISVVGDSQSIRLNENTLTFTSITTLCLSLLIFGFKFGETAANHRSCYLSLQKLRGSSEIDVYKVEASYIDVLGHHPNHTTGDYMRLAVDDIFSEEQSLTSGANKVRFSCWRRIAFGCGWLLARALLLAFATIPFILVYYGIDFNEAVTQ